MAIRTSSNVLGNNSYPKPSTSKKTLSSSHSGSSFKSAGSAQSSKNSSAPKRDKFIYSSVTPRQTPTKTSATKTTSASKSPQKKTSTAKTNLPTQTGGAKIVGKAKQTLSGSNAKRDSFEFSSEALKGKCPNKGAISGSLSKKQIKSTKNKVPEGLKLHLQHTNDPKQKAGMKKTIKDIENNLSSKKTGKKTYISPKKTDVSSGIEFSIDDILKLDGSTVFVVNDGKSEKGENVVVDIDKKRAEIIMTTSNEFDIDPTLIIAVMAHESRFQPNSSSGLASGLMQINDQYFSVYASDNKELIKDLGGDYTNIYDEAANIVSWGAAYSSWVDIYGDSKDSLKALRQGYKGNGWTSAASQNAEEFIDIKRQLEENIK